MRKYKSVLATEGHNPIKSMSQFGSWDRFSMGFFLNDKVVGGGDLLRVRYVPAKKKTCLQTESTFLNKKFRRKGHGIHLYHALIKHARKVGAERIYSSRTLNRYSRRMWSEKLKNFYDVCEVKSNRKCHDCGCKCRRVIGYYIVLKGKK